VTVRTRTVTCKQSFVIPAPRTARNPEPSAFASVAGALFAQSNLRRDADDAPMACFGRAGDNPPWAQLMAGLFASSMMLTPRARSGPACGGPNSFQTNLSLRYSALRGAQDSPHSRGSAFGPPSVFRSAVLPIQFVRDAPGNGVSHHLMAVTHNLLL
jgi:hypothetical protein